jgi:hypothetical protein
MTKNAGFHPHPGFKPAPSDRVTADEVRACQIAERRFMQAVVDMFTVPPEFMPAPEPFVMRVKVTPAIKRRIVVDYDELGRITGTARVFDSSAWTGRK